MAAEIKGLDGSELPREAVVESQVRRAFSGQHVPELPPAIREIVQRSRHRVMNEATFFASGAMFAGGEAAFTRAWQGALDEIFDEAIEAVRVALEDMNPHG